MKGLIYTYFFSYVGAVVALFFPLVGLAIYINFAVIKPEAIWGWAVPPAGFSRVIAIAMLIGWGIKGFGKWDMGRGGPIIYSLIAFVVWASVGWGFANYPPLAQGYVVEMLKILLPILVGITLIKTPKQLITLAWIIVFSQGYLAYEFNLSYYYGNNWAASGGFAGLDNNTLAVAMVTGIGLAFFMGIGTPNLLLKIGSFISAAMMAHVVMFSFSRGGMLALLITACSSFFLVPRKPKHYVIFVLAIILGLRLAGPQVRHRFSSVFVNSSERDASSNSRLKTWGICWSLMKQNPIIGVGPNHFPTFTNGVVAHSVWLQTGAEMGFPGLALLLAFFFSSIVLLWPVTRNRMARPDPMYPHIARGVIASFIGFGVAGQFVTLTGLEQPYYIGMLGAVILKLAYPKRPDGTPMPIVTQTVTANG